MSYKITIDGDIFCSSKAEKTAVSDPKVKLKANNAGSLTFTMLPDHPYYDSISDRTSVIDVYLDGELIFEGVPVSQKTDFLNRKVVECEGELSFLNDTVQRQAVYQDHTVTSLMTAYLTAHNAQADAGKQFTVGNITVDGGNAIYRYTNYETTMTEIGEDLLDNFGGYLRVRHADGVRYLDYLAASPRTSSQVIRIGKNLIDLSKNLNSLDICTVLIPLGMKLEEQVVAGLDARLTIESVNNNLDYLIGSGVSYFGNIWRTKIWDDVTTAAALKTKGQEYLEDAQWENLVISASAIDLGLTEEDVQQFRVLDKIRVVSEPHGLDRYFILTELEIDLDHPGNTKITLGENTTQKLSASVSKAAREIEKNETRMLVDASGHARHMLETATGGNIYFHYDQNGVLDEIRIMDSANPQQATKIWRWNINGWGYSGDGGQTYTVAATMDGAILASMITTGILKSDDGTTFYLDLDNGILRANFSELKITGSNAASQSYADSAASSAAGSAQTAAEQNAAAALQTFITGTYNPAISNLQAQIDGQIDTYFDNYVPTLNNYPANGWTTTADKDDHLSDLFYVVNDPDHGGECYRFVKVNGIYSWQQVEDTVTATALQTALNAYALAGIKKTVFTAQPVPPYAEGDLWIDGADIYYCTYTAGRSSGSFVSSDWELATNYIDQAQAEQIVNSAVDAYDQGLTSQAVFNKLTNNGQVQGLYYQNGKVYVNADYIGSGTISGREINNGNGTFKVTSAGVLTATSATIQGKVTATDGKIANWTINGNLLECITSNTSGAGYRTYINGVSNVNNVSSNGVFGVQSRTSQSGSWSNEFYVLGNGKLYAKNAEVEGKIKATSGAIGGFTIETDSIRSGNLDGTGDGNVGLTTADFTRTIGGTSRSGLRFAIGANFGVTKAGVLYAKSAVLNDASITNGSIHITTSSETNDLIKLSAAKASSAMQPDGFYVSNTSSAANPYLSAQLNGGGLFFRNTNTSKNLININTTSGYGWIGLRDNAETLRVELRAGLNTGNSAIYLYNASSKVIAAIYPTSAGIGTLSLRDSAGTVRAALSDGGLYFYDSSGNLLSRMTADQGSNLTRLGYSTGSSYSSFNVTGLGSYYKAFALIVTRGTGIGVMDTTIIPLSIARTCVSDGTCSWCVSAQNSTYQAKCYFDFTNNKIYITRVNTNADCRAELWGLR